MLTVRPGTSRVAPGAVLAFLVAMVAVLATATPARAQRPNGQPVRGIVVDAPIELRRAAENAIANRIGEPIDAATLRRSIQNIYALGRVSDVHVDTEPVAEGVRLRFTVLPAASLVATEFEGDSPVRRGELRDALTVREGDRLSRALIEEQAGRVQGALADRGYLAAMVEPELLLDDSGLEATLLFHLTPGEATRLDRLELVGDLGITEGEVRQALLLQEGGVFRYDQLAGSIEALRRRLAEARFFHARIQIADQALNQDANTAELVLSVEAGPRVDLQLRGLDSSEEQVREMLPFFESASVADWILIEARSDIIAGLQEQGYWKPLVTFGRVRDDQGRNIEVSFTVARVRRTEVREVIVRGNATLSDEQLRAVMGTSESGLLGSYRFLTSTWEQDQRNIVGRYRREGYLQARVLEAPVDFVDELGGLRATLVIEEGNRTVADEVRIVDATGTLADYGIDVAAWAAELALQDGGPYAPEAVREDETRLLIALANEGFSRAQVVSEVEEGPDPYVVTVRYTIHPGRRTRVGQLLIAGNDSIRDEVIRRELTLVPGSPLTQEGIIVSQSRLYQLGVFNRVDIETAVPNTIEDDPTVVVHVTEGSSQRLSWGIGYSTEEQVRGLVVVGDDNLWGLNHRATASVRASFAEQRVRFIYTDPYLLGRALEGSLVGYFESIDQEGFKLQRIGASAQVVKHHTDWLTSVGRYSYRDQQTFEVLIDENELEPEDRGAVVGSVTYSLLADTRPNPIDPQRGTYHTVDVEQAARALGSANDFTRLFGRSYWYWPLPGDTVFVAAARAGLAVPWGDSIVPLPERFFAGGSTTLRGFGRNLAGPTDVNGNPLGGNVLLIGNLEYRFPIRGSIGAAIFTDIGNVFADPDTVALTDVRETIGLGVRYDTPIGPLRVDWGYLLDARPGEDTFRFHFAIGQAF